jgi:hypothetical protein
VRVLQLNAFYERSIEVLCGSVLVKYFECSSEVLRESVLV